MLLQDGQRIRFSHRSGWWVDPDSRRQCRWYRCSAHETFGMGLIGRREHLLPCRERFRRLAAMNGRRRQQPNPTMMVILVVPLKKRACPRTSISGTAKLSWKARPIFQRLELTFRIGVIVRDVRPRMGLRDAQIGQQVRNTLWRSWHSLDRRAASVGPGKYLLWHTFRR